MIEPLQMYSGATDDPCLTCGKVINMVIMLNVRQGSELILRNIMWKITREKIPNPIIEKIVL